mgnify:CR=1 FL=1
MTDLTELWKKGELPEGRYYVENNNGIIGMLYWSEIAGWYDIKEVKAKVPTYEEYQALLSDQLAKNEGAEIVAELNAKNKKLKYDIETYHSQYKALVKQNSKLLEDSQVLTRKLLQTNPDLKEWLEKNYKEYL